MFGFRTQCVGDAAAQHYSNKAAVVTFRNLTSLAKLLTEVKKN